ncbi:hypothetical protein RHSIM_Rhsim04G0150900 [Rhododendron simsii]|uniref:DNA2/NAM7 helicase-like C-terminal domain-containing protein n=1 Tax=Rhododendron simsii TaxID=118357 RepID=A0A834H2I5_RHOSS|nr:hypothetical protein RHSIM_Rhsim04G0150900 [Rhododendron simsii]
MYGPYSFINISYGREVLDYQCSRKNLVEVAVVMKLLQLFSKAFTASKRMISIGVVSPYSAQIVEIQQRLGSKYENLGNFPVKVRSIDGFQVKAFENVLLEVKKKLNELEDFLNGNSILFKSSRWKVLFSEYFRKSFVKPKTSEMKNFVLLLLSKLSIGCQRIMVHPSLKGLGHIAVGEDFILVKRLDGIFGMYKVDYLNRCEVKCFEG